MEYRILDPIKLSDNGEATLTPYLPVQEKPTGAVVILPGGAYRILAGHEGDGYARFLAENGIAAYVVKYRVAPERFPLPLLDSRRAIRTVRKLAQEHGIIDNKIAIMGSSAGGHLAALTSTWKGEVEGEGSWELDALSAKPDFQILCYPVILSPEESPAAHRGSYANLLGPDSKYTEAQVSPCALADADTPPAFIWHTSDDPGVNVTNSYRYAEKLRISQVQVEMHILPHGRHGLGLAPELPYVARWGGWLLEYLRENGF